MFSRCHMELKTFIKASCMNNIHTEETPKQLLNLECESFLLKQNKKTCIILRSVWVFFGFPENRRPNRYYLWEVNLFSYIQIVSLMCLSVNLSWNIADKMLVVFLRIFVADTKMIFGYNFLAPSIGNVVTK